MTSETAFVGDVHGNLGALQGIKAALAARDCPLVVFLGDYINKGPQSAEVLDELLTYERAGETILLAGNHESTLLEALNTGDLSTFLKIGGAATIRSYVGGPVGPDVLHDLRTHLPSGHISAMQRMQEVYETDELIARHITPTEAPTKFVISAHSLVGKIPRISGTSAQIDTGCGTEDGRLTALLWPSLDYVQVNSYGSLVKA